MNTKNCRQLLFSVILAILLIAPIGLAQTQSQSQNLTFEEYEPKSTLVVPEHKTPRAKFPMIDIHSHHSRLTPEYVDEKAVNPAPDPDGWFHARIVVANRKISVFVNDAKEPSLVVEELSDRKGGLVGLWLGEGSGGAFANLKITPEK